VIPLSRYVYWGSHETKTSHNEFSKWALWATYYIVGAILVPLNEHSGPFSWFLVPESAILFDVLSSLLP